jgi:hypothetical protein
MASYEEFDAALGEDPEGETRTDFFVIARLIVARVTVRPWYDIVVAWGLLYQQRERTSLFSIIFFGSCCVVHLFV